MAQDLYFDSDLALNPVGDFITTSGEDAFKQSIMIRLMTPKGSNAFHPDYGNGVHELLSENIDETWIASATDYVRECVEQDERIQVVSIETEIDMEARKVSFRITFRVQGMDNMVVKWGESIG